MVILGRGMIGLLGDLLEQVALNFWRQDSSIFRGKSCSEGGGGNKGAGGKQQGGYERGSFRTREGKEEGRVLRKSNPGKKERVTTETSKDYKAAKSDWDIVQLCPKIQVKI